VDGDTVGGGDAEEGEAERESGNAEGLEGLGSGSPFRRFASAHEESLVLLPRKLLDYLEFVADEKSPCPVG